MSQIIIEEWRDLWSFKSDFMVVACAFVFSASNMLRMPFLVAENGGLAFIAAYLAIIGLVVLPLVIMEMTVGQVTGRAPIQGMLSVCPLFKGVGIAQIIYTLIFSSYMAVWLSYIGLFLYSYFYSLITNFDAPVTDGGLEFLSCNSFGIESCRSVLIGNKTLTSPYGVIIPQAIDRWSASPEITSLQSTFTRYVEPGNSIEQLDHWCFYVMGALAVVWICVYLAICAGVRWLGKVVYCTYFLSIFILIALLVRALTTGDVAYKAVEIVWRKTEWEIIWDSNRAQKFWMDVISQALYSCGLGFGAFITLSSYNKRQNNLICDAIFILLSHLLTTAMTLILVYALAAVMAERYEPFRDLTDFLSPDFKAQLHMLIASVSHLEPVPKLWPGLFLFMIIFMVANVLYTLALNTLASLEDALGEGASRCLPRASLAFLVCGLSFALALIDTTAAGTYIVDLTHRYMDYLTPWVIITIEIIAIAWFYCAFYLGKDIRQMVRACCCWCMGNALVVLLYITPAAPLYVLVQKLLNYDPIHQLSDQVRQFEHYQCIGWAIAVLPLIPIPCAMLYMLVKTCITGPGAGKWEKFKYTIISPLRYEVIKPQPPPRYTATAPGYVLLPQAPLAEPEPYDMYDRSGRVSNI